MNQLVCDNLTLGYQGKTVIENLSFSVKKGDYLCIIGGNGSGKTTLVKAILGLIPMVEGGIKCNTTKMGYLPQQINILGDFPASVKEIVLSGTLKGGFRPFWTRKEKNIAEINMKKLGIEELSQKSFSRLSGGQKQKVLLARALCAAEEMLLLDEPVAGLDGKSTEEMYKIINELNKKGTTIIMISHDINSVLKYATHILDVSEKSFLSRDEFIVKKGGKI